MNAIIDLDPKLVVAFVESRPAASLPLGHILVPVVDDKPTCNLQTERLVLSLTEIAGAKVIRHYVVQALTAQEIYEQYLVAGYTDAITGLKLKTTEYAQAKFSQLVTLISTALAAGAVQPTDTQTIYDYAEEEQSLTVTALLALLLRYGFFCTQIFHDHAP